jgi:chemotaxis protein MotC
VRRQALLAAALAALAVSAPPHVDAEPPEPATFSSMADDVQRLQTRIAEGDRSAYPTEMDALKTMAQAISAAAPETWSDKREADALVVYVLSGGALPPVVSLVRDDKLVESERALARAALAYVTNHEADALELLGGVDLTALDVRLAGPIAFARSVLKARKDPKAAIADLDWARLLAPGGLVEEAALRREIGLLAEAHDAARMAQLSRQYAERFAASLYAPDFFRDLALTIARTGLAEDPDNFRRLSKAAARLPGEGQRDFLLTLAHASTIGGRFDAAALAASEALRRAAPGGVAEARGRLYLNAGRIFSGDAYESALAELRQISVAKLDRSDAALLTAALGAATQLRATPDPEAVLAQAPAGSGAGNDGEPSTIHSAEEELRRTESLAAGGPAP